MSAFLNNQDLEKILPSEGGSDPQLLPQESEDKK